MWNVLTESKTFKILKIIAIVLISIGALLLMWNIGKFIVNACTSDRTEGTFPKYILLDGHKYQIEPEEKGAIVHFQVTPPLGVELDVEEIKPILVNLVEIVKGSKYSLGNILGVISQTGPDPDSRKARTVKARRVVKNTTQQGMLDDEGHSAVRNKIAANQVVVKYGNFRMYGLRWKERDIIFPAHIVTNKERYIQVTLPVSMGNNNYTLLQTVAYIYHLDADNDIGVARIADKSVPNSPDLTKYFHKEANMRHVSETLLMKRTGKIDEIKFFSQPLEYFVGNAAITTHNAKSVTDLPQTSLEFYLLQSCNIPTKAGDCGSIYLSLDRKFNTAMILGMHTNISISNKKSWGNVLSQEYLKSVAFVSSAELTQRQGDFSIIPVDLEMIDHPSFEPLSTSWSFEDTYDQTVSNLLVETTSDIFYSEENKESNLFFLGREVKFKPPWIGKPSHKEVPWSQELEEWTKDNAPLITKEGHLSVTSVNQLEDTSALNILGGKPSLIATQIAMISDPIPWTDTLKELLRKAMPMYKAKIDKDYGRKFRVLTDFETINGLFTTPDEWYGHLNGMDMHTSAGDYPRRFFNKTRKEEIFKKIPGEDRDEWWWRDDVASQKIRLSCANTEEQALEGVNSLHLTTDSLKYELIEKPNKTRVFQCCSIQDVFIGRKYFGTLLSKVAEKHLEGTCSVGIDPIVGFHQLANRFKEVSLYGEAGDFKRWDKHLLAQLMKIVIKDIAERYIESDPQSARYLTNMYNVLTDKMVYTLSSAEGHWYVKMRGNPSGCVLTSVLNSFVNLLMTYMAIQHIVEEHNNRVYLDDKFLLDHYGAQHRAKLSLMRMRIFRVSNWVEKNFDCAFYGDDKITAISPDYLWLLNFLSFRKFYTTIMGIDYDSPNKDGKYVEFDKIENLSYLSRSFTTYNGTVLPALKRQTVNAFYYWSRELNAEQYKALFEVATIESALHGEEYYKQARKVVIWIVEWLRKQGITLDYNMPLYEQIIAETVSTIQHGRSSGALITSSAQARTVVYEINRRPTVIVKARNIVPLLPKTTYKNSTVQCECVPSEQFHKYDMGNQVARESVMTTGTVYDELMKLHEDLLIIFSEWEGSFITGYHPYPALVQGERANQVSICFKATDYDYQYRNRVQSELTQFLCMQLGVKIHTISIVYRILGPTAVTAEPIWQICFEVTPTTPAQRLAATGLVLKPIAQKKRESTQSTGTDGAGFIEEHVRESDADVTMPITQGVARGMLIRSPIWNLNLAQTVQQLRETADSPLSVAMGTAVHTVIDKVSYGDVSNFPTAARFWALAHESGAPTIYLNYTFISAATIVNQLIVGVADSNKSTYTMEELQQIEGVVINPQDGTIDVPLHLAAVTADNSAPTRINMSQTPIQGTDAAPILIPTLVILTATAIQNAYDNDKVQVNIRKKARFGNITKEPWHLTSRSLAAMKNILTPTPSGRQISSFQNLSSLVGLPTGYPVFITCDGAYIGDFQNTAKAVTVSKYLSDGDFVGHSRAVSTSYVAGTDGTNAIYTYDIQFEGTAGSNLIIPLLTKQQMIDFYTALVTNTGDNTATQLKTIFGNKNCPTYGQNTCLIMVTMGDRAIPSSRLNIQGTFEKTPITDDEIINIITKWADAFGDDWSYTLSEFPADIEVKGDAKYSNWQATRYGNYSANISGEVVTATSIKTSGYLGTKSAVGTGTAKFKWVIEMQKNNEEAVTVYCGIYLSGPVTPGTFNSIDDENADYTAPLLSQFALTSTSIQGRNTGQLTINSSVELVWRDKITFYNKPARVIALRSNAKSTLDTTMSKLTLSATLPKTIPQTIADRRAATEVHDDYTYNQLRLFLDKTGLMVSETQVLIFQLYMRTGISASITAVYDQQLNEIYIVNKPSTSADSFKTLRKLTAEDIYIGGFRVIERASSVIDITNTSSWVDRVVSDTSTSFYTGALTTRCKVSVPKRTTSQAAEMLPLMLAQQGGNFMQSIMQYYMMKNQLSLQQQQKLEQMEKEFQYKLKLQQDQQDFRMKYSGLANPMAQAAQVNSASSSPGIGFVPASTPNATMNGDASPSDNFDAQMEKFRDMLYKQANIPATTGEDIGRQLVAPDAGPNQPQNLPETQPLATTSAMIASPIMTTPPTMTTTPEPLMSRMSQHPCVGTTDTMTVNPVMSPRILPGMRRLPDAQEVFGNGKGTWIRT